MKRHFFGLFLITCAFSALAAEVPPPDKLLPNDTLLVLTIPDYPKGKTTWKQAAYGQLWADSAMRPFREKLTSKLKSDLVEPLEREFGVRFSDYADLAQGQITLAVTPGEWGTKPDQSAGFLLLLDTKTKSDVLKTNLAALKQKWIDNGKQIRTEKIREVELTGFIFSSKDLSKTLEKAFPKPEEDSEEAEPEKPKKDKKLEWFVGQSDSLLVVGNSVKDIEKVLVRQGGGGVPSLSEQASFASRYGAMFRDAPVYGWANLKSLLELASKSATDKDPGDSGPNARPKADKILAALGLTGLESLSLNCQESQDGSFINFHIQAPEATRKGLLRILSHQTKDANPPAFVPADAVKFFRWRLDAQKAWSTVESMVGDISPQYATIMKTMLELAGKDKDPNFDFRKQLIGNLGDDLISYEKIPRNPTLEELNSPPSLFLLGSPRAEELATAIKAVSSFLPQQGTRVKEREFLGRKVYTMTMTRYTRDGKREDRSLHYSASGGYVGFSYDVAMLEEYLRGSPSKALRDMPGLSEAAQKIGGMSSGLFGFENQAESGRATLEILKKESGSLANLLSDSPLAGRLGVGQNDKKFKEWFDFSLLPAWDRIGKYFNLSVWSGALTADGMSIKVFSPTPPGMKKSQ